MPSTNTFLDIMAAALKSHDISLIYPMFEAVIASLVWQHTQKIPNLLPLSQPTHIYHVIKRSSRFSFLIQEFQTDSLQEMTHEINDSRYE